MPCCCGGKPDVEEAAPPPSRASSHNLAELQARNEEMVASHPGEMTPEMKAKLHEEEEALIAKLKRIDDGLETDARRHVGEHSDTGSAELNSQPRKRVESTTGRPEGVDIPACLAHAAVQLQMAYPTAQTGTAREAPVTVPVGVMHAAGGGGGSGAVVCRVHASSAFREIRASCSIGESSFWSSLMDVTEIGNPGKGGQRLFRTGDKQFFLKSMAGIELTMLEHIMNPPDGSGIERYVDHMATETLLCKFVGWLSVDTDDEVTWLIVMCNILPSTVCGVEKLMQFDLKGSWHGRKASEKELKKGRGATLKDLDFWHEDPHQPEDEAEHTARFLYNSTWQGCLGLQTQQCEQLLQRIENALDFLGQHGVMDHSLLMGLYEVTDVSDETIAQALEATPQGGAFFATATHLRVDREGALLPGRETRCANFIVHCGIIDVLQTYNRGRKFQHHFVGAFTDAVSLSSVPAPLYRDRMKLFMNALVFAPTDDVPASLAEAVATVYTPPAVGKDACTEEKAVLESFEDFMALLAEMGESRDGVVVHAGSKSRLNMVPRRKHPVVEHGESTPDHPVEDTEAADALQQHQRIMDEKLSSIVDMLKNHERGERVTLWNLVREERLKIVATADDGSPGGSKQQLDLADVQVDVEEAATPSA